MKTLADLYIWTGGPIQSLIILFEIINKGLFPISYLIMMFTLNILGIFYGINVKDWRFIMFATIVSVEYFILILINL